jgi:hypothetical protein
MYPAPKQAIYDFLRSTEQAAWIVYGPMEVYVRRGTHFVNRQKVECFDIANVAIGQPELRGKGTFKAFIQDVENIFQAHPELLVDPRFGPEIRDKIQGIYVENVYPEQFAEGLMRMGFEQDRPNEDLVADSYYSPLPMPFGRLAHAKSA